MDEKVTAEEALLLLSEKSDEEVLTGARKMDAMRLALLVFAMEHPTLKGKICEGHSQSAVERMARLAKVELNRREASVARIKSMSEEELEELATKRLDELDQMSEEELKAVDQRAQQATLNSLRLMTAQELAALKAFVGLFNNRVGSRVKEHIETVELERNSAGTGPSTTSTSVH